MRSARWIATLLFVGTCACPVQTAAASDPCGGGSSFAGQVLVGGFAPGTIELKWMVYEDSLTRGYRLMRAAESAQAPNSGPIASIARVNASSPDGFKTRAIIDTAPPGDWTYRLEIDRRRGPSCTLETTVTVPSPPPCDLAALCSQVGANFTGEVIMGSVDPGTVQFQWAVNAETVAVNGYRLSRFNCSNASDCSTEIAMVMPTGTCGQVQLHSLTDTPPPSAWTYRLEVLDSRGRTSCAFDRSFPAP